MTRDGKTPEAFPLRYCPGGWETLERLKRLYEERPSEQVCATFPTRTRSLERFAREHPAGFCDYPDPERRIAFWDAHLRERAAVVDDSVPSAYLSEMDQGLYGALLGGEIRFLSDPGTGWISSMSPPLLEDLSEAARLTFDPEHPWFRRYLGQMDLFARRARGRFGISHLILVDSLNLVFELIGATNTYLALTERPQEVARAVDFAFELNVNVHEAYFQHVGLVAGGTVSNMTGWTRGRIVNESVDPFHMTSVRDFERWGREPVERIFRRFDGGVIHIHGNGRHLLEAVAEIPGLKAIYLGDDRGFPSAFSVLPELKARVKGLPLVVNVGCEEFVRALDRHALVGGVLHVVTNAPGIDEANRTMDAVRAYRP